MENQELIKPVLDLEPKAQIKSLGVIEDNILDVKEKVIEINNYYKEVKFTEETMKQATEEKVSVNKFKKAIADYRKNIIAEYKKPIETFEKTAKETEKLLEDTYKTINEQVENYNNQKKEEIRKENEQYFNEYCKSKNIDFVTYKQANINVTLSSSKKSLQEQAKAFIDKITDDLNLIETQEHKAEILVEYKQSLNVSQAITTVTNRFKAIEEEKKKQEELKEQLRKEPVVIVEKEEPIVVFEDKKETKANNEFVVVPIKREITIKINAFDEDIEKLKRFLEISNIEYESEEI